MKKKLLTFFAILFSFAFAQGQHSLVINLDDNSNVTTAFENIQKITFDNDKLLLKTTTGTTNSYLLDHITSITFIGNVGIKQIEEIIDVHVYINSSGEIVVETPHQIHQLTVFDITGRKVAESAQNAINVNFLSTGVYILQVVTDKGLVSKKFIKNR